MDQENFDYLTERLKYTGFEDKLNKELEKQIKAKNPAFTLPHQMEIEGKKVDFQLHFKKSEINDRYFYNKVDVTVQNNNPELEGKSHSFYQNQGITAKESFNLLEGRPVFKTFLDADKEQYNAWIQLDLSKKDERNNFPVQQFHEKYGFDLEAKLKELPIKELEDETKKGWILKSLQKGNQYPVSMERNGLEEIMFVEANPKFKSINVYDASMSSVKTKDLLLPSKEKKEELDSGKNISKGEGISKESTTKDDKKKVMTESQGNKLPKCPQVPKTRKSPKI